MDQRILYIDPWSGISGDMLVAALVDTTRADGRLEAVLQRAVGALGLEGAAVHVTRDSEWGVSCSRVTVDDGGAAPLRHLADMEALIAAAPLSDGVRSRAAGAVRRLAEVEAAIHGCSMEQVHFHEVGAVDTLVDVVGAFALVEALGVDRVAVGRIPVGGGTVEIAHGRMGVPAPATARLLEGYDVIGGPEMKELTTPTGALLVRELGAVGQPLPALRPELVGYGGGYMKLESGPNLLRVLVGSAAVEEDQGPGEEAGHAGRVVELQTNLDDVSPEVVGHTCGLLREAGALDVWTVGAFMKKGRPGVVLHVLVALEREDEARALIFQQTGTLGIRRQGVTRHVADRGTVMVAVSGVDVRVKWGRWHSRLISVAPEYEDAASAATALGLPAKDVVQLAAAAARKELEAQGSPGEGGW